MVKVRIDSTGKLTFFFPVAAAPAVPAAPPAPAPMAAPLPPPAIAPMIAPAAAPPPMAFALRPLCPFPVLPTVLVITGLPLMDVSCSSMSAVPDSLPEAFASTTLPTTGSPRLATTRPFAATSSASVPFQVSPERALSDEIVCPRRTFTLVPDGIRAACARNAAKTRATHSFRIAVTSRLMLSSLAHAFFRFGHHRDLSDRDHVVWRPVPEKPTQPEELFSGWTNGAMVGHRPVDCVGGDQHAHGHRHAGARIRRQFSVSSTRAGISAGAHRDFSSVPT